MIKEEYDNYIFDLYGTLLDLRSDEHCAKTWKKWCKWLDKRGIKHPHYIIFRRDFFTADKNLRKKMLLEGNYDYPEIDVIDIYTDLFEKYGNKSLSSELISEASYAFRAASMEYIRLYPGVKGYLSEIRKRGKHAYILSNAQASYTRPEIIMFGLDKLVDDYIMSSDYRCMKPDKRFFQALMEKHNMDPARTLMHGDSEFSDVGGAKNAGIDVVHLVGENHPREFYLKI